MSTQITKAELRIALGLESDAALAKFYGVSRAAIAQWAEDEPIPELRRLQAISRRPDLFGLHQAQAVVHSGASNDA